MPVRPSVRRTVDDAGAVTAAALQSGASGRREALKSGLFVGLLILSLLIAFGTLITLILDAVIDGWARLDLDLLTNFASSNAEIAGLQAAIFGTLWVMFGLVITVVPLGVGAALYLEEYANRDRWYNRFIELNVQNLAAVPSIVFGILGLGLIVRGGLSLGPVAYAGALTLSLLVLPTVILASREAIRAVPSSHRQASLALGATKLQTIRHHVLPQAIPGIMTGTILAVARAIGETAPLLLVGATVFVTFNPDGLFAEGYTVIPVQVYNWVTRPSDDFRILSAAGIVVLLGMLLLVNASAIYIRNRWYKKQAH
ncbi:MAG: phosphate ABC transporter permease PstA [Miltoncostaeaceae bacterium]